jgi:hypothetical protein
MQGPKAKLHPRPPSALNDLRSPPCLGAFIAIVADCHWTPFSPLSESFSEAAEGDQVSLVASLLGNYLASRRYTLYPLPLFPWWVS